MTDTVKVLSDDALRGIEARANAATDSPWEWSYHPERHDSVIALESVAKEIDVFLCTGDSNGGAWGNILEGDAEFITHAREDIPALCATVRALRSDYEQLSRLAAEATVTVPWEAGYSDYVPTAGDPVRSVRDLIAHIRKRGEQVGELESSVTFWQAEALLNYFCSEHARNTRQIGHYCTVCAKPFTMSVQQGERPPKYKDLITENTALQNQLAQATLDNNSLTASYKELEEEYSKRVTEVAGLRAELAQVTQERDDLLNRSHQTVLFDCGCMFKQEGLDAEPMLIVHCPTKENHEQPQH